LKSGLPSPSAGGFLQDEGSHGSLKQVLLPSEVTLQIFLVVF
jgi:hypothetical protein